MIWLVDCSQLMKPVLLDVVSAKSLQYRALQHVQQLRFWVNGLPVRTLQGTYEHKIKVFENLNE
jgi:hypothetical protein